MRPGTKNLVLITLISLILLISLTGCSQANSTTTQSGNTATPAQTSKTSAGTRTITLLDGSSITVPAEAKRVACLFGPAYEKVVLLGSEDKIIADGDFHINGWPWSNVIYKKLNTVPGVPNAHADLNLEELVKMNPDLVFYFDKPPMVEQMQKMGLYVVPAKASSSTQPPLSDTKGILNVYAQALGDRKAIETAAKYSAYFDEKLAMITAVTSKITESNRPKVYFANQKLLWAAAKNSDRPEMINLAGGICVTKDLAGGGQTEITMEQLLQWNPDFILIDHAGSSGNASAEEVIASLSSDVRVKEISAVQKQQVNISPTGVFFWDSGQQKILQMMWMAKLFHPDEFKDLDLKTELKSFYSKFFSYELSDDQAEKILLHVNP
jgi:iron complex transport system substrate-binding protein